MGSLYPLNAPYPAKPKVPCEWTSLGKVLAMKKGDIVEWKWAQGTAYGTIEEKFTSDVSRTIKGSKVKREATKSEPAFLIKQSDGNGTVLKSQSELSPVSKTTLYQEAKSKEIEGRSGMTKSELLKALR